MKANGGEIVVDTLKRMGIDYAFGIVGSALLEVFDLLPEAGINYIGARHEQWAGHMADAYGRIKGKPAVCLVQNGAGLTNMVTASETARLAHSPMVVISGAPLSKSIGKGTYQETDHVSVMKPVTKWSSLVMRPDRINEMIATAIRLAATPIFGPTHVDIPRDFLYELVEYDRGEDVIPATSVFPDKESIKLATDIILSSRRPIIVAGGGVILDDASIYVESLSELLGAPICATYTHNDAVRNDYPLMTGTLGRAGSKAAMEAYRRADCIIALGTRLDDFTFVPYYGFEYRNSSAKVIHVDLNPMNIGRSVKVTIGIASSVKGFLIQLLEELKGRGLKPNTEYTREIQELVALWEKEVMSDDQVEKSDTFTIRTAYKVIKDLFPRNSIITTDIGASPSYAYTLLKYYEPRTLLAPGPLGGVGFSIPAAMGAKIARPDKQVFALLGDGAFTMELPALITAVEYGIPIKAVVFDNSAWGAEKANQQFFYSSRFIGTNLRNPDLESVAKSIGVHTVTVDSSETLLTGFKELKESEHPSVLLVRIDPNWFPLPARRDALRKPSRGLFS